MQVARYVSRKDVRSIVFINIWALLICLLLSLLLDRPDSYKLTAVLTVFPALLASFTDTTEGLISLRSFAVIIVSAVGSFVPILYLWFWLIYTEEAIAGGGSGTITDAAYAFAGLYLVVIVFVRATLIIHSALTREKQ